MDILAPEISRYLDDLVPERPAELQEMERIAESTNFPIIGPASGQLCYLVARLIGARRIFELGSGFGYSTAWFARAVRENGGGEVHHVVWDEDLSTRAREHLERLGYSDLIRFHVAEAVETLRATDGPFDIIFNDIDKAGYPASIDAILPKLRRGGALIIDNLLWSGRILDASDTSANTEGVRAVTRRIMESDEWIASIIPLRDGVLVAYRKENVSQRKEARGRRPKAISSFLRPPSSFLPAHLGHQGQRVPLRIPEEHHPQIVIGHLRDQMWLIDELDAALLQRLVAPRDVLHLVVDHRARMIEARLLGRAQHEPHATAVEERQVRELEQKAHPERVTIELHGARNVLRADGDLSNRVECYGGRRHGHRRLRVLT